ncbi:MAG: ABC transporter permease [Methanobrevibacter sp.]|uniref:ABC transporter permease n=1 Tax=Methanobrevibacter sp. TaxID=66852 RepID=UPI0026DF57EC|nr:ABC transporter permease [Methanobrevibacter sp.]MDO5848433.1 ABC transporter permease [Methanobrevibacter sp.]
MSFLKLILKNPFRRKTSAILAIVGICIGITTIVALGGITDGLVGTFEDTIHAGGADFTVTGKDSGNTAYGTNTISSNWTSIIASVEGVNSTFPIYVTLTNVDGNPMFTLIGINANATDAAEMEITSGRIFKENSSEIVVGKIFAENKNLSIGDSVSVNGEKFEIVGTFESGDQGSDGGAFTSISKVGEISGDEGSISNVYVVVDKESDPKEVADRIDEKYGENITTVSSVMEMNQMADMLNMLKSASLAISLLAIVVGGLGIINTMLMSVFERTREIGVLKAVGWSNKRILLMIVGESLVITILSAILGSIIGYVAVTIAGPMIGITPIFTLQTFAQAFIIAIAVGIIGGIFPAMKAMKLPPTEALRYE